MSLSRLSRCRPEPRMSRRYSSWRSLSSPNIRSSSTSENPITAFSGVRSSCDMLARNSDLCWLTTSSSAVLVSSSRNRRAFHTARADWLAKVSRNSIVSSEKAPGRLRRTTSAPMIRPPRSTGTASTERQPSSCRSWRWGSRSTVSRSATAIGCPSSAARPTSVVSSSTRIPRSLRSSSALLAYALRTEKLRSSSTYSMIDPPSQPENRTAFMMMFESTSSSTRLELITPPTSLSASSCSTLRASSTPRSSSARTRCTLRTTIGRLRGERLQQGDRPIVERVDLGADQRQRADDLVVEQHRRRDQGSVLLDLLEVLSPVLRVAEHVGDLLDLAIQGHAPDQGRAVDLERMLADAAHELVREPDGGREREVVAVDEVDRGRLAAAQSPGALDDAVEHRIRVGRGSAEGGQHLVHRRELLGGVGVVTLEALVRLLADLVTSLADRGLLLETVRATATSRVIVLAACWLRNDPDRVARRMTRRVRRVSAPRPPPGRAPRCRGRGRPR